MEGVVGGWGRLCNEQLHNLYTSPDIIRVITNFWLENLKGRDHSEDIDIDGRVILRWILRK
jgi:hypothetical protein